MNLTSVLFGLLLEYIENRLHLYGMNICKEFPVPISCSLSLSQAQTLNEFIEHQGFDGKVGMHLSPPPHPSVRESTPNRLPEE